MKIELNASDLLTLLYEKTLLKQDMEIICNDTVLSFGAKLSEYLEKKKKKECIKYSPFVFSEKNSIHQCKV